MSVANTSFQFPELKKHHRIVVICLGILLAIALRVFFLWIPSHDIDVIQAAWYDELIEVGRFDAFETIFYNYTPAPVYVIDIMTLFRFIPKEPAMKLIPILFDFLGALGIYKILRLHYKKNDIPWLGFFGFLFLPTVFIESAAWGQTDILFTTFLIWSFYYFLQKKTWIGMLLFAISFCFKLQSLFLGPLLLVLFLRKKIPFYQFFMIPVVFFISLVPAWAAGAPLKDLLLTYSNQFITYNELSKRAPNIYAFIESETPAYNTIVLAGIIIALLIVLFYVAIRVIKWKNLEPKSLILDAALFTFIIPFLLPKMHDRYFYLSSAFLLILCFFEFRSLDILFLSQIGSLLAFIPYFSGWKNAFVMAGVPFMVLAAIGIAYITIQYHRQETTNIAEKSGNYEQIQT